MKVKVVRNWADASNAWIDVQTYTKLKLPPAGMQYKISFFDKFGTPAQMTVTSSGVSWVDGLGGGYKGKTVLDATVEEPKLESEEEEEEEESSGINFDKITSMVSVLGVNVSGAGVEAVNGLYKPNGATWGYDGWKNNYGVYLQASSDMEGDNLCWLFYNGMTSYYKSPTVPAAEFEPNPTLVVFSVADGVAPVPSLAYIAVLAPIGLGYTLITTDDGRFALEEL